MIKAFADRWCVAETAVEANSQQPVASLMQGISGNQGSTGASLNS